MAAFLAHIGKDGAAPAWEMRLYEMRGAAGAGLRRPPRRPVTCADHQV